MSTTETDESEQTSGRREWMSAPALITTDLRDFLDHRTIVERSCGLAEPLLEGVIAREMSMLVKYAVSLSRWRVRADLKSALSVTRDG